MKLSIWQVSQVETSELEDSSNRIKETLTEKKEDTFQAKNADYMRDMNTKRTVRINAFYAMQD